MVIQYLGDNSFIIKTKMTEITAGLSTVVGELTLAGPGEYEIKDTHIQGYPGAYLISAEDLNVLYVDNPKGLSDEVVKKIEVDVDILLLALDQDTFNIKNAVKLVADLDPDYTIPAVDDDTHPFCKEIGGCQSGTSELKVSKKDMVEEVRKVVVLNAVPQNRK